MQETFEAKPTSREEDGKMAGIFSHKVVKQDGTTVSWCRSASEARLLQGKYQAEAESKKALQ